jgi:hypothetical protein
MKKLISTTKYVTAAWVLAGPGLFTACASDGKQPIQANAAPNTGGATSMGGASNTGGASKMSDADTPTLARLACPSADPSYICSPNGFAFAQLALAISDYCKGPVANCALAKTIPTGETTANVSQPAAGTLCLSGVVAPGGWAQLGLEFLVYTSDGNAIASRFDAKALGITQVQFAVDTPPSGGLLVEAAVNTDEPCPSNEPECPTLCSNIPHDCFTYGFGLMTDPGSSVPLDITTTGTIIAPFGNFEQTVDNHNFDTSAIHHISFNLASKGPFDFCIHDFEFLDAQGNVVNNYAK